MKITDIYHKAIEIGIKNDPRGKAVVREVLRAEKIKFDRISGEEADRYEEDRLFNPYADTRILCGDRKQDIKTAMVGIDMETPEILLAHTVKRDMGMDVDLVIAHHPEGRGLSGLHDVMRVQTGLLESFGVNISVAEHLMDKRISEVERRMLPVNHERSVSAARLLGIPMMCIHTPADNCVTTCLADLFAKEKPVLLGDLVKILNRIPEYRKATGTGVGPKIVSGSESNRCGKIYVDMTGGTEGSKDMLEKEAAAGISTVVGMHMSEDALEKAKKANLNVVIAGHISSDTLGLNLLFDELEKAGRIEFICVSGFERIRAAERTGTAK